MIKHLHIDRTGQIIIKFTYLEKWCIQYLIRFLCLANYVVSYSSHGTHCRGREKSLY